MSVSSFLKSVSSFKIKITDFVQAMTPDSLVYQGIQGWSSKPYPAVEGLLWRGIHHFPVR
jgi:hypothetical protein